MRREYMKLACGCEIVVRVSDKLEVEVIASCDVHRGEGIKQGAELPRSLLEQEIHVLKVLE